MQKIELDFEVKHGKAPQNLRIAAAALDALYSDDFSDALGNDAPEAHAEITALVALCRKALQDVETFTRDELQRSAAWHRENLQKIEAIGVLEMV